MNLTRTVAIVSGKGGVGKTTFAANLAIALNNLGKRVVVVDCNVTTPHLAYYLGARSYSVTLNSVFKGNIDINFAPTNRNNIMLIPASEKLEDLKEIKMEDLKKHIRKLADSYTYDFILLDSAPGLGKEAVSVLNACEEIVFVTTPTIPNIADVTRCAEVASEMGINNFKVVLNMVRNKKFELKYAEAESFFGYPVLGSIPFDMKIMDSTAQGIPMLWYKPSSDITRHYAKIAANLTGIKYEEEKSFGSILNSFKRLFVRG